MAHIFISYRRDDSAGHTGRLVDWLAERFRPELIFRDLESIEPGKDFVEAVTQAAAMCEVLLAIIGRMWVSCTDSKGNRRLANPEDLVRVEVATALRNAKRVIPVLVHGASMPVIADLPSDLGGLARMNAIELSDKRWAHDVEQLSDSLQTTLGPPSGRNYGKGSTEESDKTGQISIGRGLRIENSSIGTIAAGIVRGRGLVHVRAREVNVLEGATVTNSTISEILGFSQAG